MKKKIGLGILGLIVIIAILQFMGIVKPDDSQGTQGGTASAATSEVSTEAARKVTAKAEESTTTSAPTIAETASNAKAVYDYFDELLKSSDNPSNWEKIGNEDMEPGSDEWKKVAAEWTQKCADFEQDAMEDTAEKFGITADEVGEIYLNAAMNNISDKPEVKIIHGELVESTKVGSSGIVIKAKISPSYSNKSTIDQNYFNIEDFVKNQGGDQYDEIQYWAVADMTDGSEGKVISFTLNKELIQAIKNGNVFPTEYENYLEDLYILPSLFK